MTVRGVRVGSVESVRLDRGDVVATAKIDSDVRIPVGSAVRVSGLSLAGEQYLDFVPTGSVVPYLGDGAVISRDETSTPVTLPQVLGNATGVLSQLDPDKLHAIVTELGASPQAPQKLADIIDGGTFMIATLSSVLPQTVSLLHNSQIVLGTLRDMGPGLRETATDLNTTFTGVEAKSAGFAHVLDITPTALHQMDQIIADNSPTMVQLLGNLTSVAQMAQLHAPAMRELLEPQDRDSSAAEAIASVWHENRVWASVNIYPRVQCDYDVPRLPDSIPNYPEPYLYVDCPSNDPNLLPRGARNAPRPPGDPVRPPPGTDPLATTDPTPTGPWTVPTPYGGVPEPGPLPK